MNDLLLNGSGYKDFTAYKAIKNSEGVIEMGEKNGEIWEVEAGHQNKLCVVVSDHGNFSTVCTLVEGGTDFIINCEGIKSTNVGMMGYVFNDRFLTFKRKLKENEYYALKKEIMQSLDLGVTPEVKTVIKNVTDPRTEIERDIYKGLYEDLLKNTLKGSR